MIRPVVHALSEITLFGARGPKKVLGVYRGYVQFPGVNVGTEIKAPEKSRTFLFSIGLTPEGGDRFSQVP